MTRVERFALAAAALGLLGGVAVAQTPVPPSGGAATVPGTAAPGSAPVTSLGTTPGTLSDKLGETGGVIAPSRDVDPAMTRAAPQTGTMPVIRPGAVPPQSGGGGAP